MRTLKGIIQKDGSVKVNDETFWLPFRGTDKEGYPEVLMDAKAVGGDGWMSRQSIKPYIGRNVKFEYHGGVGYNYEVLK